MNEETKETWSTIWKVGGPPKLSHFLLKACKGNMAVKVVLFRRHIAADDVCGCCGQEPKSIIHVLFQCTVAKETWLGSSFASLIDESPSSSFAARLLWLNNKVSRAKLRCIMAIAWPYGTAGISEYMMMKCSIVLLWQVVLFEWWKSIVRTL